MPSTYTVNLGIEKPATGEQSGTWGDTSNINFDILDQAINGCLSLTLASAGTSGSPNTLAISDGATSDGRNKWVEFVDGGDLGATAYVQLTPNDAEKIVFIRNSLSGSRSVFLFQGTYDAGRDLEVPAGVDMVVKFSGGGATATTTDIFTKLRATEITTPTLTTDDLTAATADINDGTVEAVIGGTAPKAGTFTTLTANTNLTINATTTVDGVIDDDTMGTASATKLSTSESIKAYVDTQVGANNELSEVLANGNTTGANNIVVDSGQAITTNTVNETTAGSGVTIDSVLLKDDGVNATQLEVTNIKANDGTAAGSIANSTGAVTLTSFISNSVDIGGGAIDGTTIGASSAAAGSFTTGTIATADINGGAIDGTVIGGTTPAAGSFTTGTIATADINGGAIDGTTIGATTPAAISGTTGSFSSHVSLGDNDELRLGDSNDLIIEHTGTSGDFRNSTGDMYIRNFADDADIYIQSDNGSGDTASYFVADGSTGEAKMYFYGAQKLSTRSDGVGVSGKIVSDDELIAKVVPYSSNQNAPYMIAATTSYTGAATNSGTYGMQHRYKYDGSGSARITVDASIGGVATELWALYSGTGNMDVHGSLDVGGSLSKGSGSFKIDHPLKPETHHLVHSFVEAPQADNIYRGKVSLVAGAATVNLDEAGRMTEGTFVALNGNIQCFTSNEDGWTAVRGSVSGNTLTVEAQDATCTDTVSWLVIGERHDSHMLNTDWTDAAGRVITEPEKQTEEEE